MTGNDLFPKLMVPAGLALFIASAPFSPLMIWPTWVTLVVGIIGMAVGSVLMFTALFGSEARKLIRVSVPARSSYSNGPTAGRRHHL